MKYKYHREAITRELIENAVITPGELFELMLAKCEAGMPDWGIAYLTVEAMDSEFAEVENEAAQEGD